MRHEVFRRLQVWDCQEAPARRYALHVAGYFWSGGPFFVEGEETYLRFRQPHALKLLEWVEVAADRRLTPAEMRDAAAHAEIAPNLFRSDADGDGTLAPFDPHE